MRLGATLVLLAGPLSGQGSRELDAGRFEIRAENRRIGVESYRVWRDGNTVTARGRLELEGASGGTMETALQLDGQMRPTRYALRAPSARVTSVDGAWNGNLLRLGISSEEGERWREFLTPGPVALLEEGVAHHAVLLLRQMPEDPAGWGISVIVPSRGEQTRAVVRSVRSEPLRIRDETVEARVYEIEVGGRQRLLWTDGEGRLLQMSVPEESRTSVRLPEEG